jgi:hypothetical protein
MTEKRVKRLHLCPECGKGFRVESTSERWRVGSRAFAEDIFWCDKCQVRREVSYVATDVFDSKITEGGEIELD